MNHRQQRFVLEYLQDANLTQAAIRAGYRPRWAHSGNVVRLAGRPDVRAALAAEIAARARRTGILPDRVLDELVRIAFAEIGRIVEWRPDGALLKPRESLSPDDTAAIAEMALDDQGRIVTLRLHDKEAALAVLARRLGVADPPRRGALDRGASARLEARLAAVAVPS
jgi:phage terminase small subunit